MRFNGAAGGKGRREEIEHNRPLAQRLIEREMERLSALCRLEREMGAALPVGKAAMPAVGSEAASSPSVSERARFFRNFICSAPIRNRLEGPGIPAPLISVSLEVREKLRSKSVPRKNLHKVIEPNPTAVSVVDYGASLWMEFYLRY
jgi:hypothetical protein